MRFSDDYKVLQKQLHADLSYGTSGYKHADRILDIAKRMNTRSILDYGCGKQTLQKAIPFPITNYDPMIAGLDANPAVHDLVVCSDVLEHIEPECLDGVLAHLREVTGKALFVDVACRPAKKTLADGRNAHLIQEKPSWWLNRILRLFDVSFFQVYEGGFIAVLTTNP